MDDQIVAYASFEPESGIALDTISDNREHVEKLVAESNTQIEATHGMKPWTCRRIIVALAD